MSIFNQVQFQKPGSNTFDLSYDRKQSMKMGELTPMHVQEVIPGDKINMSTAQMIRFAPMLAPIMHQVNVFTHFFFVPNRIIWPGWENFITGGEDGYDDTAAPYIDFQPDANEPGLLGDYLGLPYNPDSAGVTVKVSPLPLAAYTKIYNEYYRDQNLQTELIDELIDGDNTNNDIVDVLYSAPIKRAWQHDYFTSALPWTQKGPQATIPLGTAAPIVPYDTVDGPVVRNVSTGVAITNATSLRSSVVGELTANGTTTRAYLDLTDSNFADLSQATAASIIDLRRAFKLQQWLEKNARGGSRYVESILSHFGVRVPDSRLQRPEYLGGGKSPVSFSEVLQTSDAAAQETPQGNMAGHGISVGQNHSFSYNVVEHGYIIGIMSVMPRTSYFQGIPRHYFKFDKFDYFWTEYEDIGEQPIYNKELFVGDDDTQLDQVFGYTPRYAEYKFMMSSAHGTFRTSLDFWHMARKFEDQPNLNAQFISCDPTTRIFAVLDTEQIYAHIFHKISARRHMKYFGNPKF